MKQNINERSDTLGKVASYIRVSTDEQVTGFSIEMQKERLRAYCLSQGWSDIEEFVDDGYTGTNMNRPALKSLFQKINRGVIESVVVYKLDRLGRKQKDVLFMLEDVFEKNNVAFKSATEPFDTSTPLGKAMLGILAVFGQLERDMIIERTTSGRRQRIKEGMWSGGRVPLGYSWNKETKMLEINPDEAWIVKEIFTRFADGKKNLAIAEWASRVAPHRTFDHSVIRDMMHRKIYIGILQNGEQEEKGLHQPIIDDELWDRVQKRIKRNKKENPSGNKFMLTGLLKCELCGETVQRVHRITRRNGKIYDYSLYACRNQHVRAKDKKVHCKLGYFRQEKLEKFVEDAIFTINLKQSEFDGLLKKQTPPQIENELSNIRKRISEIDANIENLFDAIQSGIVKANSVADRLSKLELEREDLLVRTDEIESQQTPRSFEEISQFFITIREIWGHISDQEKCDMLSSAIDKIIVRKDGNHEIVWNVLSFSS